MARDAGYDWVTFLSDYGHDDVFVGVCKGVIAQVAPHPRIIDISHLITPQDGEAGAHSLNAAMPFLPRAVHLAMVDPQHAKAARGVVVRTTDESVLIGPDNGLLSYAWESRGGVESVVEIANRELWLEHLHATFRGRDVFAPVAGHIAQGRPLTDVGPELDPGELMRLELRAATVDDDHVHAEILAIDHFGNVSLNLARADLEAAGIT